MQPDSNGLVIKDVMPKVRNMSNVTLKALGLTEEGLARRQELENAAIIACGAMLGNCHLMAEVVDWILTEEVAPNLKRYHWFLKQPWCKQEIKVGIKTAVRDLRRTIDTSRRNSMSDHDYINDVADNMFKELKPDLFKLYNAILLELGKHRMKVKCDIGGVAYVILIMVLLQWIAFYYDETIEYMKKTHSEANYESWYNQARCSTIIKWWKQAVELLAQRYFEGELDLNGCPAIANGMRVIDNRMRSAEVAERVTEDAGEKVNEELIERSFKMLNIGNNK